MTKNQFNAECAARYIAPDLALENDDLLLALIYNRDAEVLRILDEEF